MLKTVKGYYTKGRIEPAEPLGLKEGAEVEVTVFLTATGTRGPEPTEPKSRGDARGFWITVETGPRIQSRASLQDAEMDGGWMCAGVRGDESPGYTRAVPSGRCVWASGLSRPAKRSGQSISLGTLPRAA